ncbi:hypothetical protein QJS10_CPA02g00721 [Acorus calamus]|uniref:Dirigent protein n=1 Tax=Acorus calamus TaxID=4465 RepID=A0AAV9FBX3_ACOCL|nr:hypothetical protein QJS10_CPA02g00721 [Acorus calamus]
MTPTTICTSETVPVTKSRSTMNVLRLITLCSNITYGVLIMMDEPLTEGPDLGSALVGRAEGHYGSALKEEETLAVVGRNTIYSSEREMAIVGGTGKFRFARGYGHLTTHSFNTTSGDAVIEYNIFIVHR